LIDDQFKFFLPAQHFLLQAGSVLRIENALIFSIKSIESYAQQSFLCTAACWFINYA
jgi:hypothetical protein